VIWSLLTGLVLVLGLVIHFVYVAGGRWIIGPETFFLVMAEGTYVATAYAAAADGTPNSAYVFFIAAGIAAFIAGTLVSRATFGFDHRAELERFRRQSWTNDLRGVRLAGVVLVGVVSIAVTVLYFTRLGFFVPAAALSTFVSAGPDSMMKVYNSLRSASTTGEYLGLGYVIQFKNCLLPLTTLLLYYRARVRPSLGIRVLVLAFALATALASVGTGARFPLAFLGASFLILGVARLMEPLRLARRTVVVLVVLFLVLLSSLTLMMGARGNRTLDLPVLWAPYQVVERVFIGPSVERFHVYELYLSEQEPQWGRGTLRELRNVLPGRAPLTLTNRLHQMLYGSPRGNVSLDYWGAVWYDFHWFGTLFAFFHGFLLNAFYVGILRGRKRLSRVVVLLYAGIVLGFATDPQVLLLRGFLTCFLFLGCLSAMEWVAELGRPRPHRPQDAIADA